MRIVRDVAVHLGRRHQLHDMRDCDEPGRDQGQAGH